MENSNSVVENGSVINIPIGFRFRPTDTELVLHYLKRKLFSLPLPATVIPDLDVFQLNPWDLPGDLNEKRYFFTQKKMNLRNKCSGNWSTDCGYWKATKKEKQILLGPANDVVIGLKKSHVFYKREKARGLKTQWVMQEFCLLGSATIPYSTQRIMMQVGDWVVCRVYQRKRRARKCKSVNLGIAVAKTTSCESGVTEVSTDELDQEASSGRRF
ncbi:hypothetical protein CASFOL_023852 [Castilleja foliolosa]|uniref:NAC domain-containing protein n=1 Tax=Castilleja foliolosa TaxID=1961234 RepID=A0ABD3CLP5_9LAMI